MSEKTRIVMEIPKRENQRILLVTTVLRGMGIVPEVLDGDPVVIKFSATEQQIAALQGDNSIKGIKDALITIGESVFNIFDFITLDTAKILIKGGASAGARIAGNAVVLAADTGAVLYSASKATGKRIGERMKNSPEAIEFQHDAGVLFGWLKSKAISACQPRRLFRDMKSAESFREI